MPMFRKFDPYAFVQNEVAAKAAKPAKADRASQGNFSNFSEFSGGGLRHELPDVPLVLERLRTGDLNSPADPAAGSCSWPASAWRRLYEARLEFWALPRREAYGTISRHLNGHVLAWSDMQNLWHKRHGERPAPGTCAGCGAPIGDERALQLDGYHVHLGRDPDCLVLHGNRWRAAAAAALKALGLVPPKEDK